jgi:hypothetical protein
MMFQTVPDFFQEETEEALRSQVEWLGTEAGVDHSFFARLLSMDEATLNAWLDGKAALPSGGEQVLRRFWRTALHLLSFLNFDLSSVRILLRHELPAGDDAPPAPPWSGSSLQAFLEAGGARAVEKVDRWVTGLRFGDPYAAGGG